MLLAFSTLFTLQNITNRSRIRGIEGWTRHILALFSVRYEIFFLIEVLYTVIYCVFDNLFMLGSFLFFLSFSSFEFLFDRYSFFRKHADSIYVSQRQDSIQTVPVYLLDHTYPSIIDVSAMSLVGIRISQHVSHSNSLTINIAECFLYILLCTLYRNRFRNTT